MPNNERLETKIKRRIERWFKNRGDDTIGCMAEFCNGNRASLGPLMDLISDLGSQVFADGNRVDDELLEDLEYRLFDLIGKYSSAPGGERLFAAIRKNVVTDLTVIFSEAKRHWNLNTYKIAESVHVLDPEGCIIADSRYGAGCAGNFGRDTGDPREQAREVIEKLIEFAKSKFRGVKNKKIAVNWLGNPDKATDLAWLASLAGSSKGSTKVTLSRIRRSILKNHYLKRVDDRFILDGMRFPLQGRSNPAER